MVIYDVEQGTDEWLNLRSGIPTASNFKKIVTSKGWPSKQQKDYMYKLAGEIILGEKSENFQSEYMQRGNELEDEAIEVYEKITGYTVERVGFCLCDEGWGASPDGLINEDGQVQIKCPKLETHIGYLLKNKLPTDYFQQVQGELFVTGRKWSDFVSYYPKFKPMIVRVERDEDFMELLEKELHIFLEELNKTVELLIV